MTREEAIDHLSVLAERMDTKDTDLYVADIPLECVDMAIKALEQEPCDDAISRQAVLDAIKDYATMLLKMYHEPFNARAIMDIVQDLPSVTPQPKTEVLDKIRAEMEKQIERDFAFAETETQKVPYHYGIATGLQNAIRIIDSVISAESEVER